MVSVILLVEGYLGVQVQPPVGEVVEPHGWQVMVVGAPGTPGCAGVGGVGAGGPFDGGGLGGDGC